MVARSLIENSDRARLDSEAGASFLVRADRGTSASHLPTGPNPKRGALVVRDYDLTLIFRPDLGDEGLTATTDRVGNWITTAGGEVVNVQPAGRKRLAFPIKHLRDGSYVVVQMRARGETLGEVERNLKLSPDVLRHMFIRR